MRSRRNYLITCATCSEACAPSCEHMRAVAWPLSTLVKSDLLHAEIRFCRTTCHSMHRIQSAWTKTLKSLELSSVVRLPVIHSSLGSAERSNTSLSHPTLLYM